MQRRDAFPAALAFLLAAHPAAAAAPKVAASIAPLAGIAAAVLGEDGPPALLLPSDRSPHRGALQASQTRVLADADVVLWIGPDLERGIGAALDAMPPTWVAEHTLRAEAVQGVRRRPLRRFAGDAEPTEGRTGGDDPHLWLDPGNAAAIARALAERLAILEPPRAAVYRANAERFAGSMTALEADLAESLAPVRGRRFVVFHDAYRYFETAFGLEAVAALTDEPGEPIGGRRLAEVRARAEADGAVCVFADAQAPEGAVTGIARDLGLKPGVLDPLGAGLEPGVDSYAILLKRLAEAFRGCLAR